MRRREFIRLLGGATGAWPLAARAQQSGKVRTIGVLGAAHSAWAPWTAAFVRRLHELGWIEGRTVAIQPRIRHTEGQPSDCRRAFGPVKAPDREPSLFQT